LRPGTRGVELLFEFVDLAAQPLPLGFRSTQVGAQLLILPAQSLGIQSLGGRTIGLRLRHEPVMPDSGRQYKRKDGPAPADPLT